MQTVSNQEEEIFDVPLRSSYAHNPEVFEIIGKRLKWLKI